MHPALQITADVVSFRLRRLEMANLAGALAIALTLRLPAGEVAARLAFALLLNVLVYLNNDYCNLDEDLSSGDRDARKTRYLDEHRDAALLAQVVLVLLLAGFALLWSRGLLVALVLGGGACWAYSAALKQRPLLDVLSIFVWGLSMPLVGFPLDATLGWCLALQLGLTTAVFETIQVVRDRAGDAAAGIRTTAVALGVPATRALSRALILLAALYTALAIHPGLGLLPLAAAVPRLDEDGAARYWNQVRLVFGVTFLLTCALVFVTGGTAGLALEVGADQRLPALSSWR